MVRCLARAVQSSGGLPGLAGSRPLRLSLRDIKTLLGALLDLYQLRDVESFCQAVPAIVGRSIPAGCIFSSEAALEWVRPVERAREPALTERERFIMELLRPHLNQAYCNARLLTGQRVPPREPPTCLTAYGLRPRETEIAQWVAQGKTNSEIGRILQISPRTVEKHMERILEKLGVENRAGAAVVISQAAREHSL